MISSAIRSASSRSPRTRSSEASSTHQWRRFTTGSSAPLRCTPPEMFNRESVAYLNELVEDRQAKTPFDIVARESKTEAAFARELSMNQSVRFSAKLPRVESNTARRIHSGLGRGHRGKRPGTSLFRGRDQGQSQSGPTPAERETQDRLRQSSLRGGARPRTASQIHRCVERGRSHGPG